MKKHWVLWLCAAACAFALFAVPPIWTFPILIVQTILMIFSYLEWSKYIAAKNPTVPKHISQMSYEEKQQFIKDNMR